MTQLLAGPRAEAWRFELHAFDDLRPLGRLDGVSSGTFDFSIFSTIRTGGSLTWDAAGVDPEWSTVLVRPVYTATFADTSTAEWSLGYFLPAAPVAEVKGGRSVYKVELYDQLLVLDEDAFPESVAFDAGTVVTDAVTQLLADSGRPRYYVEPSDLTLAAPMVWEAGTSRLRVINDLLDYIGYFSLRVDAAGAYRAEAYVTPAARGVAWVFEDSSEGIYLPEFTSDHDTFGVPNRVLAIGSSTEDAPGLVGVAENTDPDDPLSYPSRGRWVTRVLDNVDSADQATLTSKAARYLDDVSRAGRTVEISHLALPLEAVDLNSLVAFRHSGTGASLYGVVQSFSLGTATPSLVKSTIREVIL